MCLVSYIPNKDGYILSSNRDESPLRSDTLLTEETINNTQVVYPKDMKGGSWIYLSQEGEAICVLNGGYKDHKRTPPYKMSRGIMMKHYFDYSNTASFLQHFDFTNIEPFTMVIRDQTSLFEFRWDGMYKHINKLNTQEIYIWSSSTLYTADKQFQRETVFRKMLTEDVGLDDVQKIHLTGSIDDPENNFIMNRSDRVATISHTNALVSPSVKSMHFYNLLTEGKSKMIL